MRGLKIGVLSSPVCSCLGTYTEEKTWTESNEIWKKLKKKKKEEDVFLCWFWVFKIRCYGKNILSTHLKHLNPLNYLLWKPGGVGGGKYYYFIHNIWIFIFFSSITLSSFATLPFLKKKSNKLYYLTRFWDTTTLNKQHFQRNGMNY